MNDFKDILFVTFFSIVVFFGAFFIFTSVKKDSSNENNKISIRALENRINRKVNRRIHQLQGKNNLRKGKNFTGTEISHEDFKKEDQKVKENKYKLDIFSGNEEGAKSKLPQTVGEKVLSLLDKPNSRQKLKEYKRLIIEKAYRSGWHIELNDDLEIVKAEEVLN